MRDLLCDEEDLKEAIELYEQSNVEDFAEIELLLEDISNGVKRYPRDNEEILVDCRGDIFRTAYDIIRAKYSLGLSCDSLEKNFYDGQKVLGEVTYENMGYVKFIQYFSLGILLEIPTDEIMSMVKKADEEGYNDVLFDNIIELCGLKRSMKSTSYQLKSPYKDLAEIIKIAQTDKEQASKELKNYTSKKWLKGHKGYGWTTAHKKFASYYGFWSFDSAVIAKAFGLDDSALEKDNHYPYDLAHYKSEMKFNTSFDVVEEETIITEVYYGKIPSNKELEQIIPGTLCELVNQVIVDYNGLEDAVFWDKYNLKECWYTLEQYQKEKGDGILGAVLINILVDKKFVLQLDYKEDLKEYIDTIPNMWEGYDVKLVSFELDNDQYYYAIVPQAADVDRIYEIEIKSKRKLK